MKRTILIFAVAAPLLAGCSTLLTETGGTVTDPDGTQRPETVADTIAAPVAGAVGIATGNPLAAYAISLAAALGIGAAARKAANRGS